MEMTQVKTCNAAECAFNKGNACHALAVTIGDGDTPRCDTYLKNGSHGGAIEEIAGVGACKVEECEYNEGLYCTAPSVQIRQSAEGLVCVTFAPARMHATA